MIENHGVPYAQQSPDIRAKTDQTCMERYGVLRAFLLPETFEKIRRTHKEKFGVEFPLQSKEIQEKNRFGVYE
jgi:glutathione peroxidase-family protein